MVVHVAAGFPPVYLSYYALFCYRFCFFFLISLFFLFMPVHFLVSVRSLALENIPI
jgi:hypothetical protein